MHMQMQSQYWFINAEYAKDQQAEGMGPWHSKEESSCLLMMAWHAYALD